MVKTFKMVVGCILVKHMEDSQEQLNGWLRRIAVEQLELEPTAGVRTLTFNGVIFSGLYLKTNGQQTGHGEAKRSPSFLIMNFMNMVQFNILWYLRVVFFFIYKTIMNFLTTVQHAFLNLFLWSGFYRFILFFNCSRPLAEKETSTLLLLEHKEVVNL